MITSPIKTCALLLCLLTTLSAKAQRDIVQRAIDKIASAKNISYSNTEDGTDFFGSDIHFKSRTNVYGSLNNAFKAYHIENDHGDVKLVYLFDGRQEVDLNLNDSTYVLHDPQNRRYLSPLHELSSQIKDALAKSDFAIKQLADTAINKSPCQHIIIHREEPAKNSYERFHVYISKKDNLLLAVTSGRKGELSKDGMAMGTFSQKLAYVFSDISISSDDKKAPVTINIPNGFKPEKKSQMLAVGTAAPQWTLTATNGRKLSLADLKGKVVLMDFTFNGCAACMLALPVLERMHTKYDGTDVAVVTVNFSDTKEAVEKFIKTNKVKSPIYINGRPLAKIYQVSAGPSFYLINKKGDIAWTSEGFFEGFESKVTASIEALR